MNFQELVGEVQKIKFREIRSRTETYFEAVIPKQDLGSLETILQEHFGKPLKPAGVFAEGEAKRYSKPYGGVRHEQTMYLRKLERSFEYAFLWPWGCGTLLTIKVIQGEAPKGSPRELDFRAIWQSLWNK
ncbi:MAG: hypothetical protein BWY44_00509 [Candidatus Omnitrophica bacterium ADurb.Bin292]|jgi:hypothetical protein|nr:MAG: hypothetical protein BWY44_00509 [Candidatus Omnitrophica bacterium ADurb.Bin292]HOG23244.1 hypothetical protein [Candidatus Omnitrophota bacterium]HQB12217.1 hypothetical protein [Candidatus Omnitrophota bacterium]